MSHGLCGQIGWRRLLRVLWTARRSSQPILQEICPGCSLEGLMLKLKLQYFGHLMQRADSFEKNLMLGKIEDSRRRGRQRMRWLDSITDSMDMGLGGLWELVMYRRPGVLWFMGSQRVGHDWATELNWTELKSIFCPGIVIPTTNEKQWQHQQRRLVGVISQKKRTWGLLMSAHGKHPLGTLRITWLERTRQGKARTTECFVIISET